MSNEIILNCAKEIEDELIIHRRKDVKQISVIAYSDERDDDIEIILSMPSMKELIEWLTKQYEVMKYE